MVNIRQGLLQTKQKKTFFIIANYSKLPFEDQPICEPIYYALIRIKLYQIV